MHFSSQVGKRDLGLAAGVAISHPREVLGPIEMAHRGPVCPRMRLDQCVGPVVRADQSSALFLAASETRRPRIGLFSDWYCTVTPTYGDLEDGAR